MVATYQNASYPYSGWDGKTLETMTSIDICNYVNALLANKDTDPVEYTMSWEIETYSKDKQKVTDSTKQYRLEITGPNAPSGNSITGTLEPTKDGKPVYKDTYKVSLKAPTGIVPETGEYVQIVFYAENKNGEDHKRFDRKLQATFIYTVNLSKDYIRNFDAVSKDDAVTEGSFIKNFEMQLGTSELPSMNMDYQTVVVWWKTNKVEVNLYNFNFLTYRAQEGAYTAGNASNGYVSTLKITGLGSNKYRPLEFFIQDPTTDQVTITNLNEQHIQKNTRPDTAAENIWLGCYVQNNKSGT